MRRFIILIGISSLALSNDLPLSLENAIEVAINNSFELSIAKDQIISAYERENQARKEFLPKLSLELETGYDKMKTPSPFSVEFLGENINVAQEPLKPWKNKISLNLKQRLYSGGEISSRVRLAKIQKEYLGDEKELVRQDLILSVTKAYWSLKYSLIYADFAKKRVNMLKTLVEMAKI